MPSKEGFIFCLKFGTGHMLVPIKFSLLLLLGTHSNI